MTSGPTPDQAPRESSQGTSARTSRSLTLTTGALTLVGVVLSIGLTVAFGISGSWWIRVAAGCATSGGLIILIKLLTKAGRGPLARFAHWIIGSPEDE